jgi:hypothetical protein
MTTITIDDEQAIERMAAHRHKAVNHASIEVLEDYQDTRSADIESGKEQFLDWRDVKSGLYDMDH